MNLSQNKRAVVERQRRSRVRDQRRMNTLTVDFVSVKYPDVYEEACQFYRSLNRRHPKKHNLTKTHEYKLWKTGIVNDQDSEDGSNGDNNLAGSAESTEQAAPISAGQIPGGETDETSRASQNIIQEAAEGFDIDNVADFGAVDDIINEIIVDLQQDDILNEYLNAERAGELVRPRYEEENEGIGLNVETELQAVLEPFDYEIEVEQEGW